MSNLPVHFLTKFDTTVRNEYQYEGKLMYDMFYTKMGNAKTFDFNKQGIAYTHKHITNSPLVLDSVDKSKVQINVDFYDVSLTVDPVEQKQINYSEEQELIFEAKTAMGRRKDAVLLEAITNTATTNVIPKNVSGSNDGLTVEALIAASKALDNNHVPRQGRVIICDPNQMHNLLKKNEVISRDYNNVRALVNGDVNTFMGFQFITIPQFEVTQGINAGIPEDSANSETYCYCFVANSGKLSPFGCAVNTDINFQTDKIPHMGFSTLIHGMLGIGAKEIDSKGVVKIVTSIV